MVCTHTVTVLSLNNPVPSLFVVFDCIINTSVGLGHVCTRLIIHTGTPGYQIIELYLYSNSVVLS